MDQLKKRDNETELEYHKRLVNGKLVDKTLSEEDYAELSTYVYGKEYSSDVCRRMMYGSRYSLDLFDSLKINSISDNSIKDEITLAIRELQKERAKVQTEKIENNKSIREIARVELYIEKLEKAIQTLSPLQIPKIKTVSNNYKEAIISIADAHFGRNTMIKGLKGEIINEYNEKVFQDRMWALLDETVSIINKEGLSKINIINCGDVIEGILRQSQLQSLQYGIIDSVIRFSDFFANWINELSQYVCVDYYSAYGNHDQIRPLGSKNGEFPNENVGKLINHFIKTRLINNPNVNINETDNDFGFFNVQGLNIMITHGEEGNLEQAIKDYSMIYKENIDLLICGHLHSGYSKSVGIGQFGDIEVIRVPSLCGIDDYSMKLRKSSCAGSKLLIIEEGKGKTITYDIVLK